VSDPTSCEAPQVDPFEPEVCVDPGVDAPWEAPPEYPYVCTEEPTPDVLDARSQCFDGMYDEIGDEPKGPTAAETAAQLGEAMSGMGTDETAIHDALRGKTPEEIEAIKAEYAAQNDGADLGADLGDELSGEDLAEAEAYMEADPVKSATVALQNAASGMGTDEHKLIETLKALPPEAAAQVRAQFKEQYGMSVDDMLKDELSGEDLERAKEELDAKFTTGLGAEIDDLAKQSPTLRNRLNEAMDGGHTIRYGEPGKGSFRDPNTKEIVIDPNDKGSAMAVVKALSHEAGHATYTVDPWVPPDGLTKEEFVHRNMMRQMKDEGEATISNIEIRAELIAAGAGDIGISGAHGDKYQALYERYPRPEDRDKLREEIGKLQSKLEVPSTPKDDGTDWKDYEEYYSHGHAEWWDENVAGK